MDRDFLNMDRPVGEQFIEKLIDLFGDSHEQLLESLTQRMDDFDGEIPEELVWELVEKLEEEELIVNHLLKEDYNEYNPYNCDCYDLVVIEINTERSIAFCSDCGKNFGFVCGDIPGYDTLVYKSVEPNESVEPVESVFEVVEKLLTSLALDYKQ